MMIEVLVTDTSVGDMLYWQITYIREDELHVHIIIFL